MCFWSCDLARNGPSFTDKLTMQLTQSDLSCYLTSSILRVTFSEIQSFILHKILKTLKGPNGAHSYSNLEVKKVRSK